jgi:hypothetical protein
LKYFNAFKGQLSFLLRDKTPRNVIQDKYYALKIEMNLMIEPSIAMETINTIYPIDNFVRSANQLFERVTPQMLQTQDYILIIIDALER